jgi:hypothetical protein
LSALDSSGNGVGQRALVLVQHFPVRRERRYQLHADSRWSQLVVERRTKLHDGATFIAEQHWLSCDGDVPFVGTALVAMNRFAFFQYAVALEPPAE